MSKKRPGFLKGALNLIVLVILILTIRWILFEVFVIPSGSMYPKLHINDYIIVTKYDYGLRLPFTKKWLLGPYLPKRNSVVVFRSPNETKYYVKRLVALPGDRVVVAGDFILSINGNKLKHTMFTPEEKRALSKKTYLNEASFEAFYESGDDFKRIILTNPGVKSPQEWSEKKRAFKSNSFEPPEGFLLFMGDNRHRSHDGRRFGYIEKEKLVGQPWFVGMSCQGKNLKEGCSLQNIRTDRMFHAISQ